MRSSEASSSLPFRSKKTLNPIPKAKPQAQAQAQALDLNPLRTKTPTKQPQLPRRIRKHNVALSLKEVRKAAQSSLSGSNQKSPSDRTDQISSARRKIVDFPEENAAGKSKTESGASPKLPEKYELLSEFFYSLDDSIRLLRLKGSTPNFTNIRPKIQCFTDRRFTYGHLAQLKFILPDVIEIKKTLIFDERTSCMKPDLHITMNLDALENGGKLKSENGNLYLRRVFRSRLADFSRSHPEAIEVPKETLPEPFNVLKEGVHSDFIKVPTSSSPCKAGADAQSVEQPSDEIHKEKEDINPNENKVPNTALLLETSSESPKNQQSAVAAHLHHSFRRHFSKKPRSTEVENTPRKTLEPPSQPTGHSFAQSGPDRASSSEETSSDQTFCPLNATPRKELSTLQSEEATSIKDTNIQSTPAKLASTPARLMTSTPGLCPPKRSYMSPEDNSTSSPHKLVRRAPRSRSLKFDSPVKNNRVKDELLDTNGVSIDNDLLDILPENLLQSIRDKEMKAMEERDPAISQAKRRQQMIAYLPKLFNMIHFLFQSINRSVITKEELVHKIISGHLDIVDRSEVEEQLTLLQELVPDWISEKLTSGGDLLLRINKMSSPESIRARLEEAK